MNNNPWKVINEAGLEFFGRMNASISHEIKNVLAIISQNAGLLEDLSMMAEQDMPLDPHRIKSVAGKIQQQVRRADVIVKNMNSLAHSVDEPVKKVDAGQLLVFMALLCKRLAGLRSVSLEPAISEKAPQIVTRPFLLETLLWRCLDFSMSTAGAGTTIGLSAAASDQGIDINFTNLDGPDAQAGSSFPGEVEHALAGELCAKIVLAENGGQITLSLPLAIRGAEPAVQH